MANDKLRKDRIVSLHSGANTRLGAHLVSETSAVDMENLIVNRLGKRTRRDGCRAFGGQHSDAPGGLEGYIDASANRRVAAIWGNSLYKTSGGGEWTQIASGASLASAKLHQFADGFQGGNQAMFIATCDNTAVADRTKLTAYDITSDTDTTSTLSPNTIEYFQGRLWAGEGDTLWWSELLDGMSYSAANTILVDPAHGGRMTRIMKARGAADRLWLFKEKSIQLFIPAWSGSNTDGTPGAADSLDTINSQLRVLTDGVGCLATRSAIWVPAEQGADVYFLSHDGIRSMARAEQDVEGGAGPALSDDIPDWIARINFEVASKAVAAYYDDAYHLAVAMDGAVINTHILRYAPATKSWSLIKLGAMDLKEHDLALTQDDLWMQSNIPGNDSSVTGVPTDDPYQVYRVYDGDLDPAAERVVWNEVSRAFIFDEPVARKRWHKATFMFSSPETSYVEVKTRVDFGDWDTTATFYIPAAQNAIVLGQDALTWESSSDVIRRKDVSLRDVTPGYNLQVQMTNGTTQSDTGAMTCWLTEIQAEIQEDEFLYDD